MTKNKILTAINGFLGVQFFGMKNEDGTPKLTEVLEGVPLGTDDQSSTGEVGLKVIVIANRSDTVSNGFLIPPYDTITNTYYGSTNNVETAVYSLSGVTVKTLTFTYAGGGASNNDLVTIIAAS